MKNAIRVYLDYNASAPLRPVARDAMIAAMALAGNPSSVHTEGRRLRAMIEDARRTIAELTGMPVGGQVVFTSGATEAAGLALACERVIGGKSVRAAKLITSAVEHPCVLAGGGFAVQDISRISVDWNGVIDLAELENLVAGRDASEGPLVVAVMAANNETGVVQPIGDAARIIHQAGGIMVVDAVQAFGKVPLDMTALGADILLVSGHKIAGPLGIGAMILSQKNNAPAALLRGGSQEMRLRAGTENIAGIAGFAAAAKPACGEAEQADGSKLRQILENGLREIDAETVDSAGNMSELVIFGEQADRLPNTTCFAMGNIKAETALIALDLAGIAVSSGAACSSGRVAASHVLNAMGVEAKLAEGAIRVSSGWATTKTDIDRFLRAWRKIVMKLPGSPARAA